jgi:addiction module HigA family antidote
MAPVVHPGRLLKRELAARKLSANRLSLDIGVPSGRVTDILHGRRSITAGTAVRLGRYFGNGTQFWLDLGRRRTKETKYAALFRPTS